MRATQEWRQVWISEGRAKRTITEYIKALVTLPVPLEEVTLADAMAWISEATPSVGRYRARALRAFLRWADQEGVMEAGWWKRIPMPAEKVGPQPTATADDISEALARCRNDRDKALLQVLWSTGMRRSEVARMQVVDVDLDAGPVIVPLTKSRRPRYVPLSDAAIRALGRYLRTWKPAGALWHGERGPLSVTGIRQVLRRLDAPSPHAFRRGWAIESLRLGISQVSVEAAGGWSGPAMPSRYCKALAQELAMDEFKRARAS